MKRLLALVTLLALPAIAQTPVISGVTVDSQSHTAVRVLWSTDIAEQNNEVRFSVSPNAAGDYIGPRKTTTGTAATIHSLVISGLAPATTYTYKVCSAVGSANEACSTPDGTFTTTAAPANRYANPALPSGAPTDTGPPAITGSTFTAATCGDVQNEINLAAAASSSLNHQVVILAGTECSGNFTLPAHSGPGWIVVRTATADAQLPPVGVQLSDDYPDSALAILANNTGYPPTYTSTLSTSANTSNWYFLGLKLTNAWLASDYLTVAAATNATPIQITTSTAHGYSTGDVIQIGAVGGNTAANRYNWRITVVDTTNFTLNGSVGNGTYTSGGWVTKDPKTQRYMYNNGNTTSNMVFDRCRIAGRDYPTRTAYGLYLGTCTTCAVVNSQFRSLGEWQAVDPDLASYPVTLISTAIGTPLTAVSIDITDSHQYLIQNNLIGTSGISVFAQGGSTVRPNTSDGIVRRNGFVWDISHKLTGLTTGVYWVSRQPLEFKRGERTLVDGNHFRSWANGGIVGNYPMAMLFATHSGDGNVQNSLNRMADITITNNYIDGSPGGITLEGADYYTTAATDNAGTGARVLVRNNVMGLDGSNLSMSNYTTTGWIAAGSPFYLYAGGEDYRIEHNTVYSQVGKWPGFLPLANSWWSGFKFSDNLFLAGNYAGVPIIYSDNLASTPQTPGYTTTTALTSIQTTMTATPGTPDPVTNISNNIFIPTVTDASSAANYGNTTYSWPVATCNTYWTGFTGITCLGTDTTTANAKIALVKWFNSTSDWTLRHDSPAASGVRSVRGDGLDAGANWGAVQAAMGWVRNPRVTAIGTTTASISYTRPGDIACTVEYGTSATFGTGTRVTDTGAVLANTVYLPVTVNLTGLTTATTYHVRVMCPAQQPVLSFTTH